MADPNTPADKGNEGLLAKALKLVNFVKAVDEGALRDLEIIPSVVEGHKNPNMMPTSREVDTGPAQPMRGGAAPVEVDRHSDLHGQQGLTQLYIEMDRRL